MATQYHTAKDGETQGPFTREEIEAQLASGDLSPDDLVFHEGLPDWIPARNLTPTSASDAPPPAAGAPPNETDSKKKASTLTWVIRGVLLLLLIGAVATTVIEQKTKQRWLDAYETADKLIDDTKTEATPEAMAKALGRKPASGKPPKELYVWKGPIFRYELEVEYYSEAFTYLAGGLKSRRVR